MRRKNLNKKAKRMKKTNKSIKIKFNPNLAILIIIVVTILVGTIATVKIAMTQSETKARNVSSRHQDTDTVTWVDSTEKDSEGNAIQVPVPKGFTASQVEGETTVNGGFVIYEGDIDWSTIIVKGEANTEAGENKDKINNADDDKISNKINPIINDIGEITLDNKSNIEIDEKSEIVEQENIIANKVENKINEKESDQNIIENTIIDNAKQKDVEKQEDKKSEEIKTQSEETVATQEETEEITPEEQTAINVFKLQKEVNQYVWVPVPDPSRIYGIDSNGKYWGKLWDFPDNGIRTAYVNGWTEENGIMTINGKDADREPDTIANMTNYDIDSVLQLYLEGRTRYEFQRELEEAFYKTIKSIEKYGGFYIGRYEVGEGNDMVVVRKMAEVFHATNWYSFYNKGKRLSHQNQNIETSIIWGSLWDETLQWFVDSNATNSNGTQLNYSLIKKDSTSWGNYKISEFNYIPQNSETPTATATKKSGTALKIQTGSSDYTKVNNIYDMAGNVHDFTLETYKTNRVMRMGDWYITNYSFRNSKDALKIGYTNYGFRSMLIIK